MKHHVRFAFAVLLTSALSSTAAGQITSNVGDGVLNAPYHGTVTSLRECTNEIGYGEVMSHTEPRSGTALTLAGTPIQITAVGGWDRSVLRQYEGMDASGNEIRHDLGSQSVPTGGQPFKRLSFKAIGTNTLAPQLFMVRFQYDVSGGGSVDVTRPFQVAPTTSFCPMPGLSEAFLLGTPILDISVGNAKLTIPVGRTAEMIGAAFIDNVFRLGPSTIPRTDCLLPGAAESVFIAPTQHFQLLGGGIDGTQKTTYGTSWAGYLIGYRTGVDIFGPDGTHWDSQAATNITGLRRIDFINPFGLAPGVPASQRYNYDNATDNRVIEIRDHATPPNIIALTRTAGVVTRITTSDGRGWGVLSDPVNGWITGIEPDSGQGARYFSYNSAGRVTQVRDANNDVMYEFTYTNDAQGNPTVLNLEKRFVDGSLQTAVEHQIVSASLHRRKEFVANGEYRQTDFAFDTANSLNHRLASITVYKDVQIGAGGSGPSHTTTYTHDVNDPDGTMVITQVALPDASTLTHQYDAPTSSPTINFGFRTKTTRVNGANTLVTFDVEYEFFYIVTGERLFQRPRIVKQRDGPGAISEVTFDYEDGGVDTNGDGANGDFTNQLLSRTGPTITLGMSGTRTPQTLYTYSTSQRTLVRQETRFGSGAGDFRRIDYAYDSLLRLTSQAVDPLGVNSVTQYAYCDTAATQDRITADPDGYWTRRRFDADGRVAFEQRFLNANPGSLATPCVDPSGPFYQTQYVYDTNGRLSQQIVDNKDQAGNPLTPATITTQFAYDRLGRLTLRVVDPTGIGSESNFDYNWQGDVEREFDTSGRGVARVFDGRGLVESETPLAENETPDPNLTTTYTYDALGNRRFTNLPTGAALETVYDDFSRVFQQKRTPGPDGGNLITTTYTYDAANNVIRTFVDEATVGPLSDSTALFDEGNFNYESRQRLTAGSDGSSDPVTQRKFDWAGNVTEERSLGDTTVVDRVITTQFDGANRVEMVTDSEGGQTTFVRDDRGNVTEQTVKLNATDNGVTTTEYDALSRAFHITGPEDSAGGRPDRVRFYDSRGNLLRETLRDAADVPKMTTIFGYDNAARQTRQAVLANAASTVGAAGASVTTDRVTDFQYDADGRLSLRRTYNNNSSTPLDTTTTYDTLGRVDVVTDPSGSSTDDNYATNGRLDNRVINDGLGSRTFTYAYDGHDRIITQTAVGTPNLVTTFTLDGLDRQTSVTDPRGLVTATQYDLAGRRILLTEDSGGAQQRQTSFAYNRLSQLITQTAMNATSGGGALPDQVTRFRYDALGRMIRAVYPDNTTDFSESQIANCTDCVRMDYDDGGRATSRTDQRGLVSTLVYDKRSLLLTRTTGTDRDTFDYDALGRANLAQRGTTGNPDAISSSVMAYTDLGDLDSEMQTLFEGATRVVDYGHDQAGNRLALTYPSGPVVGSTPTAINQVDALTLNAASLADYQYSGRVFQARLTTTTSNGTYTYDPGYDAHRRIDSIINSFTPSGGSPTTIAAYSFTRDNNGNPLSQTAGGQSPFADDDRAFTVDRLNRLTATNYLTTSETESQALDHVGNRESHTPRGGSPTAYSLANAANEYATIGGSGVTYDGAGNLTVDEAGRQYTYDEQNRLTQIRALGGVTVLANYAYDALGRRILFEDPVAGITTRYYYDGPNVIEERDGACPGPNCDVRVRFHVSGGQYVDEHVATFDDSAGIFVYYLSNDLYTVAAIGSASGSIIESYNYGAYGLSSPASSPCIRGDMDGDSVVDAADLPQFITVLLEGSTDPHELCAADLNGDFQRDGLDIQPMVTCVLGGPCPSGSSGSPLRSAYTLHGRPVDVLDGGNLILQYNRARYYDIKNGRWLQRDRAGYVDGANLYESFGSNPLRLVDPSGMDWFAELLIGSAGKNVSTVDVIFSRATADALTFGLFNFSGNPADQARYAAARRQGVVSPTITASEIALTGPTGAIRGFVARNVTVGLIFGSGEFSRDLLVNGRAQTPGEFATNTAIFTGAGATLEGVFVAGGRVLAYFRQGTQVAILDVTEQVATTAASQADPLLGNGVSQLLSKSQAQAGAQAAASEITLAAAGTGEPVALVLRPTQLELNQALGATFEQRARSFFTGQGYTILETQFQRGAVLRGLDFAAFRTSGEGIELLLVEAKASAGNVVPSRFTSLGLGRGGPEGFRRNLRQVETAIRGQVAEKALQRQLIQTLEQGSSIRLVGPQGFRTTQATVQRIQNVTERNVGVITLP